MTKKVYMVYVVEEQLYGNYDERANLLGVFATETNAKSAIEKEVNEALNRKQEFIDFWRKEGREAYVSVSETPAGAPLIEYEIGTTTASDFNTEDRSSIRWVIEQYEVIGS